jgi:hypothetical protein
MEQARLAGFNVLLFFIGLDDPLINIERVSARVQTGGHDVPKDRIIARYHRTMALLPEMVRRADRAWIFDNTVRMTSASEFAGRLVGEVQRRDRRSIALLGAMQDTSGADVSEFIVTLRFPLPDWATRYLIAPLRVWPSVTVVE